jgi:EcsC protein family
VRVAGAGHTPEKLAKIAYRKHVRLARLEGATLGIGGAITAAPDVVALLWIQSRMVFYIAAAYGYDPRHPMRPAELLALQGVYPTAAEARQALDGMGKLMAQAMVEKALASREGDRLHRRLLNYLAKRTARRYAGRLIPFIGSPIGAIQNGAAAKQIGRLALSYYARP